MKDKIKLNPAPPLLCWDIYSQYLKTKFNVTAHISEEPRQSYQNKVKKKSK